MHSVDSMRISFVGILLLLFLLAGFVVVVLLLANKKTRPVGFALLGMGGIGMLLMLGLFTVRTTTVRVEGGDGVESVVQYLPHEEYPRHVSPIELAQAEKDFQAIVPMTELVKKLEEGDAKSTASSAEEELKETAKKAIVKGDGADANSDENRSAKEEIPDWVMALPSNVGGVHRQVVDSGPWSELADCQRALDMKVRAAVEECVKELASEDLRRIVSVIPTLEYLGISNNWIRGNVVCSHPKPYEHESNSSVGPMKTVYVQLEFDPNDQDYLRQRYRDYVRQDRIAAVTAGGSFILGGIGLLFGLLKVDTWTKGYYTKRLFLGVPAAIIGVGALLALMVS